ncbi:hypothetical protein, partial [Veillonella magna]
RFLHRYAVICVTNLLLTDDFSHENTRRLAGKLIQGGEAGDDNTRGTIRFPVAAKLLNIVCTDVYYGN